MQQGSWFAVQVETLKERLMARILEIKGYECFLPLLRSEAGGTKRGRHSCALFPGYLFCRIDLSNRRSLVVTTPGVVRLVGRGATPEPVPDHEIEALQRIVSLSSSYEPVGIEVGRRVRIVAGPLRDIEGVLCQIRDQRRLLVEVGLLQRAVSVEVDPSWVVPVSNGDAHSSPRIRSGRGQAGCPVGWREGGVEELRETRAE